MVAYKIYKSGDNIEIYEYQYMPMDCLDKKEDEKEEKEEWDVPEDIDRKEERRLQTLRENGMNLQRMARENFRGNVFFLTLTIDAKNNELIHNIDKCDRKVRYMFGKLRENYGDVSYIGVREKTRKGVIHYHFIMKNKVLEEYYLAYVPGAKKRGNRTITSDEQKEYERFFHKKYWKAGFVTLTMINFTDNVGAYLAKYMTKGKLESMQWLEKRRLVLRSNDIKKVEPLDEFEDSNLIEAIVNQLPTFKNIAITDEKNKRKRVFTNGYKTKFMGQINYYDVHLNRIVVEEENKSLKK